MREYEPFKKPLEPSGYSKKIKLLENLPGKVVREYYISLNDPEEQRKSPQETDKWFKQELRKKIDYFKRGINIFHNLRDRYGIAFAQIDYTIIGGKKKYPTIYTIIDKIEGESLKEISVVPAEANKKIDEFYSSMAQYYLDIYYEGIDYWWDFKNEQVVYGHKNGEKQDKVYIVDLEPDYFKGKNYKGDVETLLINLMIMFSYIKKVENKFSSETKLICAREKICNIMANISKDTLNTKTRKIFKELEEELGLTP